MTAPRKPEIAPPARQTAFDALRAVDERDAYVNLLLPQLLRDRGLAGRDAALATELAHGTLRWRGTYDAIIDHLAPGRAIEPAVRDALRLGCHQLLAMRVPDHAAVSTSVDLVKAAVGHRAVGFANAVLRRVADRDLPAWLDLLTADLDHTAALSIRTSHPAWIVDAFADALGADGDLAALLAADNESPKVTLVARPGLCEPSELPGKPGRLSPFARIMDGGDPAGVPAVREGRAGVQDEGSQVVALRLADAEVDGPDARWLDLCAGPGGKAALLGALAAQRGATVIANEVQPHRADLVTSAVANLPNVTVTNEDGRAGPWLPASFDRALVDAPCTGLGALRRRPESRWRRQPTDLPGLVALQQALLQRALELVRPGGVVAYATCSPHVAETRDVLAAVGVARESVMQLWPHLDGTDAMFCALLRRP
ncbi:MAG TPA: transcription antitermination factor NusB [Aeromicrobium sp.]|nr:transcription antitermination factor NusB [Aeromicrobium sp.]